MFEFQIILINPELDKAYKHPSNLDLTNNKCLGRITSTPGYVSRPLCETDFVRYDGYIKLASDIHY